MWYDIEPLRELIEALAKLPGTGPKSARRIAFHLLGQPREEVEKFCATVMSSFDRTQRCSVCGNISDAPVCPICSDESRDRSTVCVVQNPQDMIAIERTGEYDGTYHILGGLIDPTSGVKPSGLRVDELLERVKKGGIGEIIVATPATIEGEITASFLANLLKKYGVKTTRPAYGIPMGGEIEFTDEVTIGRAFGGRGPVL